MSHAESCVSHGHAMGRDWLWLAKMLLGQKHAQINMHLNFSYEHTHALPGCTLAFLIV